MPFRFIIKKTLENYQEEQGFWNRSFFGDHPLVEALLNFPEEDQENHLKIIQCCLAHEKDIPYDVRAPVWRLLNQLIIAAFVEENLHSYIHHVPPTRALTDLSACFDPIAKKSYIANIYSYLNTKNLLTEDYFNLQPSSSAYENSLANRSVLLKHISTIINAIKESDYIIPKQTFLSFFNANAARLQLLADLFTYLKTINLINLINEEQLEIMINYAHLDLLKKATTHIATIVKNRENGTSLTLLHFLFNLLDTPLSPIEIVNNLVRLLLQNMLTQENILKIKENPHPINCFFSKTTPEICRIFLNQRAFDLLFTLNEETIDFLVEALEHLLYWHHNKTLPQTFSFLENTQVAQKIHNTLFDIIDLSKSPKRDLTIYLNSLALKYAIPLAQFKRFSPSKELILSWEEHRQAQLALNATNALIPQSTQANPLPSLVLCHFLCEETRFHVLKNEVIAGTPEASRS